MKVQPDGECLGLLVKTLELVYTEKWSKNQVKIMNALVHDTRSIALQWLNLNVLARKCLYGTRYLFG